MPYIVLPLINKRITSYPEGTINKPLIVVLSYSTERVNSL